MTFQYSLRFESGERRGEVVPLTIVAAQGGSFTIGRKPGNSLQVTDVSISGRHAELEISEDGVSLRDLNSTNGTMVGGRKVRQTSLEPGDDFTLGAVEFTLMEGAAPAPSGGSDADDLDELVLEDPGEVRPAAKMPTATAGQAMPRKAPAQPAPRKAPTPAAPAKAPAAPKPTPAEGLGATQIVPQEDGLEITAEDLERSAKSSKLGPIVLVGLAAVSAGAWWWLGRLSGDEDGGGRSRDAGMTPPTAPAGNLLAAGYSFEKAEGWSTDPDVANEFTPTRSARRTGNRGIQADLAGGASATIASDSVRVPSDQRSFRALGHVRADEGIELRLGLRYSTGTGEGAKTVTVWSDAAPTGDAFQEFDFLGSAPQGVKAVQVILRAECTDAPPAAEASDESSEDASYDSIKSVSVDDVALVPATEAPASLELHTLTVTALGGSSSSAAKALSISALDQPLLSSVRVAENASGGGVGTGSHALSLTGAPGVVNVTPAQAGVLVVRAEERLVGSSIATLSSSGYATHGSTFEHQGVSELILGTEAEMISIGFAAPVQLTARPSGAGVTFRAEVPGGSAIEFKSGFMEERTRAQRLVRRAKDERRAGDSGAALATWNELLTEVPYNSRLVTEATNAQGELLSEGRTQLKALVEEVERARFFGLADLFREKLSKAEGLAQRYRGSAVEGQAIALRDVIKMELAALDSSSERDEINRLEAIETVLRRRGAEDLADRVNTYQLEQASGASRKATGDGAAQSPGTQTNGGQ